MNSTHMDGNGRRDNRLPAYVLIGIGVVALLAGTGILRVLGGLIGGLLLGALAYFAYVEGRRTGNTVWRVAAYPLAGLALATIIPGSLGGGAFLAGLGLAFALVWRENPHRWWALIPAGTLASLAAVAFFQGAVGWNFGWLFLGGMAATFYALTRLEVEPQPWGIYPAAALAVLAVLSFTTFGGWIVPTALVLAGAWLLFKDNLRGSTAVPAAPVAPSASVTVPPVVVPPVVEPPVVVPPVADVPAAAEAPVASDSPADPFASTAPDGTDAGPGHPDA